MVNGFKILFKFPTKGMECQHSNEETTFKVLTCSACNDSIKVKYIQNIKTYFKPTDKVFKNIKLKSLLEEGRIILKGNHHKHDFLINYGTSLINFIGKDEALDSELFDQMDYILIQLQEENESFVDKLYTKICQIQTESFSHFNKTPKLAQIIFEKILLDSIENESLSIESLAEASTNSSKLFLMVMSIFYSFLMMTLGHWRVFEVTAAFISLVFSNCVKNGKNFLGLYPENCRRIVSLLIVSPESCSDERIKKEVVSLLLEMYLSDRKRALILLSHFPQWLCVFKNSLAKNDFSLLFHK